MIVYEKRIKFISAKEFRPIQNCDGEAVGVGKEVFPFLSSIPDSVLEFIAASGSFTSIRREFQWKGSRRVWEVVGGIDVYRNGMNDPVYLNKDWYAVLKNPIEVDVLLVIGPIKDAEHWLDDIPSHLKLARWYPELAGSKG